METALEFLKKAGVFYLTTTDGNQPKCRPFGIVAKYNNRLYICTKNDKDCYKQMEANPKVELCAFNGGQWLRVAATVVADERVEAKKHMLDAYPNLRGMYDENDGNTAVLYLTDATATFSSFTAPSRTVKF